MREILFKVWTGSIMIMPKSIHQLHEEILSGITVGRHNAMIYLQYTGVEDRNGKKIFEGDIFQYILPDHDVNDNEVVYTEEVKFEGSSFSLDGYVPVDVFADEGIVIGNIYENADLLPPVQECDATAAK